MAADFTRRQLLLSASIGLAATLTGCGTLLHEERVGQPRGGLDDVDWTVAGMNAIGLVFFFVPGVIAFAIDYYNGSLFYPPEHCGPTQNAQLNQIKISSDQISVAQIEQTLKKELGIEASLHAQEVVVRRIPSIRKFWPTYRELTQLS